MGVGNIRDVGEERTKRGILKVAATGKIATKIATLCTSLQNNKHIMMGTATDRRESGSTRCEKF